MRLGTLLKIAAALLVALVVTAIAVIYNLDFAAYKGDITAAVKQATGRDLVIAGEFRPRIGLTPAISVERVRFANAKWGSRPDMATVESFRAEIELLPILLGELRIKRLVLVGADILLETAPDGTGNWVMGVPAPETAKPAASGGIGAIPTVHLVSIERSRVELRDARTGKSTRFAVDRLRASADATDAPLRIDFRGAYNDAPITLDGTLGSLSRVVSGTDALPLDLKASAGGATIGVKGRIARPREAKGIAIAVTAAGQDPAPLGALTGGALPSIGPYRLAATVSDAAGGWALKDFSLAVGESRLTGEIAVNPAAAPPVLSARLTAPLLRVPDFQDRKAVAKPPAAGAGDRVFPATPLPFEALRAVDATVALRAKRIEAQKAVLNDVAVDLKLKAGRLRIEPARLKFAGGSVAAIATIDARGAQPRVALKMDALGLDLAALVKDAGRPGLVSGKLDFGGNVRGTGTSVRAIMAGLDGKLAVTMNEGNLDDKLLELASADVLKLISPFGSADKKKGIGINCLVGRYDVKGGRLKSLATLFDTTRASVQGSGGANLADETLDFSLVPHAKEASVMSLLVPMKVTGKFAAPSVYPDPESIAKTAVVGAVTIATGPIGLIGSVLGGAIGDDKAKPASTEANNACVAALTGKPPAVDAAPPAKSSSESQGGSSAPSGVERTLQGIGEGINKGLKGLFGQ